MKLCSGCCVEKPLSAYYMQRAGKPFSKCKSCIAAIYRQKKAGTYQRVYSGFAALHAREYDSWHGMVRRCYVPKHIAYANYGARGITVCERWRTSFENFYADMGDRPPGLSIDRINNDGNYEPSNCRWATITQQARNKRSTRLITIAGETRCLSEWSKLIGINVITLLFRLDRGWSVERAFTEPTQRRGSRVTTPKLLSHVGALFAVGAPQQFWRK